QNGNNNNPRGAQNNDNAGRPTASRGAAVRAQKRIQMDAQKIANQYTPAQVVDQPRDGRRANVIDDRPRLKIIGLGGMDGGGSKNMMVIEYKNDAIVIDCGNDFGVDLPGINYGIADTAYLVLSKIHIRGFVISQGQCKHMSTL